MRTQTGRWIRLLPDGTPLRNRLLAALPVSDYTRIKKHLQMSTAVVGRTLQEHGLPVKDVYLPNGGVFSVTNEMRNGALVEVATVGREGMLGVGVFFGDRSARVEHSSAGPGWSAALDRWLSRFIKETAAGRSASLLRVTRRPTLLPDHAVHGVQRAARRETAMLPVAAPDAGSLRLQRVCPETRISRHHARSAPPHRHTGDGNT